MERWEYQVIHLNVEPPAPAPPPAPPSAAPGPGVEPASAAPQARVEAVFSKEYLAKEFPGFYGAPPPAGAPGREHPANQLRCFLNLQGREGWQLIGFYPVGQLTMMIFRRLLLAEPAATDTASAVTAPPPPAAIAQATGDQSAVLERILSRLEALERRLPQPAPATAAATATAAAAAAPSQSAPPQDGQILSPERLAALEGLPRLSTPEAARALGFRSSASLLNLAARSGYTPGLVKCGLHGSWAVYAGSERSGRGGRDRRLWVVPTAGGPTGASGC